MVLTLPTPLGEGAATYGELRRFVVADVHTRLQRFQGSAVRFAAAWDGFSAGVEAAARASGAPPAELVERDGRALKKLLTELGVSLDPEGVLDLHRPEVYRWSQWLFLELLRRGLLKRRSSPAPNAGLEGSAPAPVASGPRRPGPWVADLSSFGDRLLNDLDRTNWPLRDKKEQRYLIGRRRGCEVVFQVSHVFRLEVDELNVFTTQVESIYGATFILIHPYHPILPAVLDPAYEEDLLRYRDRLAKGVESRISGVRTGGFALNPANLKRIPVLVSALALPPHLGGAILGVPAHDPDLYELARRLCLPIRESIRGAGARYDVRGSLTEPFLGDGTLTNSSIFSGLPVKVARERIIGYLSRRGICSRTTRFRFQEVVASLAGVWGPPVPVIHCQRCGEVPVPEEMLPVVLPVQGAPPAAASSGGAADLRSLRDFSRAACPICGGSAERDSQVLAPWLGQALAYLGNGSGSRSPEFSKLPETAASGPAPGVNGGSPPDDPRGRPAPQSRTPAAEGRTGPGEAQLALSAEPTGQPGGRLSDGAIDPSLEEGVEREEERVSLEEVLPEDRELFPVGPPREPRARGRAEGADEVERSPRERQPQGAKEIESGGEPSATAALEAGAEGAEEEEEEDEDLPPKPEPVAASRFHPAQNDGVRRWLPADAAFGRPDQSASFLLLARAVTKFLSEIGELEFQEPFFRYLRFETVTPAPAAAAPPKPAAPRPAASAKPQAAPPQQTAQEEPRSKWVVGTPAETLERYGADALRIALLAAAPPARGAVLDSRLLWGALRFLDRVWRQVTTRIERGKFVSRAVLEAKHRLIHNATQRLRRFKFHTAVASLHEFINFLESPTTSPEEMDRSALRTFLVVLSPFAPHLATELWGRIGETGSILAAAWPEANRELLKSPEKEVAVRVDGRLCQRFRVAAGLEKEKLEAQALRDEKVQAALSGRPAARVITVVDRVVNILTTAAEKAEDAASGSPAAPGSPPTALPAAGRPPSLPSSASSTSTAGPPA
jgi:leucyl-tRNA synthetase